MSGERLTDHQSGGLEKRTWILVAVPYKKFGAEIIGTSRRKLRMKRCPP